LLQNIILFFTEIDDIPKPDKTTLSKVQFTRLNIEFKPVFNLAKMFIEKIVTGQNQSKDKTFSFMFDMNVLFEQFIAGLISEIDFSGTEYAGSKIYKPSYENYLAIKQPENDKEKEKKAFALQPDILFKKDNKTKLIIDTKYKLLDEEEKNYGISQVDAYQMYAYAKKYDCPTVIMLYPKHINICDIRNEYSFDENKKLQIRIIDICINLKDKKDDLIKELKNIINYNKE
jgi:5-methylcytosine-specific restriction enzyme subunit McrC